MVLEAVSEQDFSPCSYGFRPGRSAHQALGSLRAQAMVPERTRSRRRTAKPPEGYHDRVFVRGVGSQFRGPRVARARYRVPEHPPSFPPTHRDPASPSLRRVPWDGFPDLVGTMRGSDSRPPVPPHFVAFAWRYSASRRGGRVSWVPGGPPCACALLSDPGGSATPGHCGAAPSPGPLAQTRLPRRSSLGAPSHGPRTRCLRFAGRVTPPPRKTRFRPVANGYRVGLTTHWVPLEGFTHVIERSSFARLCPSARKIKNRVRLGLRVSLRGVAYRIPPGAREQ